MMGGGDTWVESLIGEAGQVRPPERKAEEFIALLEGMSGHAGAAPGGEMVFAPTEVSDEAELGDISSGRTGGLR